MMVPTEAVRPATLAICGSWVEYSTTICCPNASRPGYSTPPSGRTVAPVANVPDLVGGDVIAWLITPEPASRDTGHIMIVVAPPVADPHNADAYLVVVIDSTTMPHAEDSRSSGQHGLGTGTIGLQTDAAGAPTGFYWKGGVAPEMPTHVALAGSSDDSDHATPQMARLRGLRR